MSKIETPWDYAQPDFYKFSEDSIDLANYSFQHYQKSNFSKINSSCNRQLRFIDLGCGCGVVGLEFLKNLDLKNFQYGFKLDFLEINSKYCEYFWKNVCKTLESSSQAPQMSIKLQSIDLLDFCSDVDYDIVFFNPPYFQGQRSPNRDRALARSVSFDVFCRLIEKAIDLTRFDGTFYFCHNDYQTAIKALSKTSKKITYDFIQSTKSQVWIFFVSHLQEN